MNKKGNSGEDNFFGAAVIPRMQQAQEGMPVPAMQPIKAGNIPEERGAPIPNMQPVQQPGNTQSGNNNQGNVGNQSSGSSGGQAGGKK